MSISDADTHSNAITAMVLEDLESAPGRLSDAYVKSQSTDLDSMKERLRKYFASEGSVSRQGVKTWISCNLWNAQ